ncbi:unnamed protein product [Nesidiocoris tenuis]|uniref:ferroxidase n=1 Tax=Nesidiocoris tenuis TaxID=355587 RepID=A0A6H5GVP4_9HEMI|nr:unnamed protein product [Nesidiocoris tenuis]
MLPRRCLRLGRLFYNVSRQSGRQLVCCRRQSQRTRIAAQTLNFSSSNTDQDLGSVEFEKICSSTLESLHEFFEILVEENAELKGGDVTYGDGVLTVKLGSHGTYVINRQSPNRQIWLSSPKSGPKRYDFEKRINGWIYKRDNVCLHELLRSEMAEILKMPVDMSNCEYGGRSNGL